MALKPTLFITGASGFMGRRLIEALRDTHDITALVRRGSEGRVPAGCKIVIGDVLNAESYQSDVPTGATFVQLVGITHPNPTKANQFEEFDERAGLEAIKAAQMARAPHFIYLSVAQPLPIMKDYVLARMNVEHALRQSGLDATIVRPFYVIGAGRWWPLFLLPLYWIFKLIPFTRRTASRLGFVTGRQMTRALVSAVRQPSRGIRVLEVPDIAKFSQ